MNRKRTKTSPRARAIRAIRTRAKEIPRIARDAVLRLHAHARRAIRRAIRFAVRHSRLIECIALGAVVAHLLAQIPYVGAFLAAMALAAAASVGLLVELLREIESVFKND